MNSVYQITLFLLVVLPKLCVACFGQPIETFSLALKCTVKENELGEIEYGIGIKSLSFEKQLTAIDRTILGEYGDGFRREKWIVANHGTIDFAHKLDDGRLKLVVMDADTMPVLWRIHTGDGPMREEIGEPAYLLRAEITINELHMVYSVDIEGLRGQDLKEKQQTGSDLDQVDELQ